MTRLLSPIIVVLVLFAIPLCGQTTTPPEGMSVEAFRYIDSTVSILKANSVYRRLTDWNTIRAAILRNAGKAETPAETYDAIRLGLKMIDPMSTLESRDQWVERASRQYSEFDADHIARMADVIGYVKVPGCPYTDQGQIDRYQQAMAQGFLKFTVPPVKGWIIDLREYSEREMWAPLQFLLPLLGDKTVGATLGPDGKKEVWTLNPQQSIIRIDTAGRPLAVLIGPSTKDGGEAIAIAFHGRVRSRFFGARTKGFTTLAKDFTLPDGAHLRLASATCVDRDGNIFAHGVDPDDVTGSGAPDDSETLDAAVKWVLATIPR